MWPYPGQEAEEKPKGQRPEAKDPGPVPQRQGPQQRSLGNAAFATSLDILGPSVLRTDEGSPGGKCYFLRPGNELQVLEIKKKCWVLELELGLSLCRSTRSRSLWRRLALLDDVHCLGLGMTLVIALLKRLSM